MSVNREGDNPSSMDGVPDLRDHNSIKQLPVLLRTEDEGCFGDPAKVAEGA